MASKKETREIKKTEVGIEYQIDVLSKEYKRLKRNITNQVSVFDQLTENREEDEIRKEMQKMEDILAELSSVSLRLQQLVIDDEASRIQIEVEAEYRNTMKVKAAVNEWLGALSVYPSHGEKSAASATILRNSVQEDMEKLSLKSAPCGRNSDGVNSPAKKKPDHHGDRIHLDLSKQMNSSGAKTPTAWEKSRFHETFSPWRNLEDKAKDGCGAVCLSERSYPHKRKAQQLAQFEEDLESEIEGIGERIKLEINLIRLDISNSLIGTLRDRLSCIEDFQRQREKPAAILLKIASESQAIRLAECLAMEDYQIEEVRRLVKEVEDHEREAMMSSNSRKSWSSSRSGKLQGGAVIGQRGLHDLEVDNLRNAVQSIKNSDYRSEHQSSRSRTSHAPTLSVCSYSEDQKSLSIGSKEDNPVTTLRKRFTAAKQNLQHLKNICSSMQRSTRPIPHTDSFLEIDNALNEMTETGRRLREHLPSIEAEEITVQVHNEDAEVFEIKKDLMKKVVRREKKSGAANPIHDAMSKVERNRKEKGKVDDNLQRLEGELSTLKVRLSNQKLLISDLLSTTDTEMMGREVQNLDKIYDEYVAVAAQVRSMLSVQEANIISESIAAEDCEVFQLKTKASKFMTEDKPDANATKPDTVENDTNAGDHETVVLQDSATEIREEASQNLNEMMIKTLRMQSAPKVEIEVFNGDPLEYSYFMENFKDVVENLVDSPKQRLVRLLKYTQGDAKELIKHCVHEEPDVCYREAMRLLEKEYGDPLRMACAYLEKLKQWPSVKANDVVALKSLHRFLLRCLAFQKKGNIDLDSPLTIRCVQLSLPINMQDAWTAKANKWRNKKKQEASFRDFADFVDEWCQRLSDPVYARVKGKEIKTMKTEVKEVIKESCPACSKQHDMDDCPVFTTKSSREKKEFLFRGKMCFCCYGKNHTAKKCESKRVCKTCGGDHPSALHGVTFKVMAVQQGRGNATCIVPVKLRHESWQSKEIEVYALLDECSDGTFISESILHEFEDGLKRNTVVEVDTINLRKEIEATAIKNLIVRGSTEMESVYGVQEIKLPETFSQERIPMDKKDVLTVADIEGWAYLKDVTRSLSVVKDIPFGLLIGNNCPKALEPLEVISSRENGPYATRSRLGWYVSAPREETNLNSFKCSNIKIVENRIKDKSISNALEEMWREDFIEKASEKKALSKEDRLFLEEMKNSITMKDGHYVLPLPLRKSVSCAKINDTVQNRSKEDMIRSAHDGMRESERLKENEPRSRVEKKPSLEIQIISPPNKGENSMLELTPSGASYVLMPDNRGQVLHRLKYTKKKMIQNEKFKVDYCSFMRKILEAGYAKKVPKERLNVRAWYIPHHGVYHPTKGKFRVVLDCSAEKDGVSLNSVLIQGPDFSNSLLGILLNFRKGKIPVMADIESMYYQVLVPEEHRKFLRFFWWEDGDLNREPIEHEMCVHPFGAISSKSCVTFALHQTAFDNEHKFGKEAMEALLQEFYIDDMLKSFDEENDAVAKIKCIADMCKAGGFNLTKFVCTNAKVINSIPPKKRAATTETHMFTKTEAVESALGVQWFMQDDGFGFKVCFTTDDGTRRGCLSTLSRIHDPTGLAAPFLLKGRKILQEMTNVSTSWDDQLPPDALKEWNIWREEILLLNTLRIPRCYRSLQFGDVKNVSLHCFSDASFIGYGVACYIRMTDEEGRVELRLIMGKSRVSPLKPTTVPRLELTAATMSAKISAMLVEELRMPHMKVYYWIDNKVVLGYIYNEKRRFRIFVANRIQTIDKYSNKEQWRYVDTKDNPSDFASRGMSPSDSEKVDVWLNGPHFLREKEEWWRDANTDIEVKEDDMEVKRSIKVHAVCAKERSILEILEERISSWNKMKRVIAWIYRFVSIEWRRNKEEEMTVQEIQEAEIRIIKLMQQRAYKNEIVRLQKGETAKKGMERLYKLNPFIDKKGVLRVGGRLTNAIDDDSVKFPIIVPKSAKATKAMISWHHAQIEHRGKHSTISRIRDFGFWVIGVSKEVGAIVHKCVRCRWLREKFGKQKMADLPFSRTVDAPPFTYCGADVFGPMAVKEGRKTLKRYGVLFTCFSLRAVHVELMASLETDSFILALTRLIARRGAVRQIRSDNGTNFVGADNELRKAYEEMNHRRVGDFLLEQGCDYIKWERNTPHASHMGGVWERQIRTVKSVVSSLVKSNPRKLDEESLRTFLVEAEGIVNSRPLTLEDLHNPEIKPLCPNQILTMKSKVAPPPPGVFQEAEIYARKRWRVVQHMANTFWSRWRKEYLQLQQSRQKWTEAKRNLVVGDIVLMQEENTSRGEWPMARVVETHANNDELVRSVTLFSKGNRYRRPVHKTVLLMPNEDTSHDLTPNLPLKGAADSASSN